MVESTPGRTLQKPRLKEVPWNKEETTERPRGLSLAMALN